ncbi:MAG: hypothetical protein HQK97_13435 [Nitrospirae bacterium]|nr:hypothetical protein [Nitrospirota bacterium]
MKRAALAIVTSVFLLSSVTTAFAEYVNGHFNKPVSNVKQGSFAKSRNNALRPGSFKVNKPLVKLHRSASGLK